MAIKKLLGRGCCREENICLYRTDTVIKLLFEGVLQSREQTSLKGRNGHTNCWGRELCRVKNKCL